MIVSISHVSCPNKGPQGERMHIYTVHAAGLVLIMLGASLFHVRLREYSSVLMTATILLLTVVIAYGRLVAMPF